MPRSANNTLPADFAAAMADLALAGPFAIALSGGGDSLALMHLMAGWCRDTALPAPRTVTVDHALRPGSDDEAKRVAGWARAAGLDATVLTRTGPAPQSDIEAVAREARYRLIGAWAKTTGITTILLAHTEDDQAETFLMRLMRGSGVDGLSAMQALAPYPLADFAGLHIARPLLGLKRADLRRYLKSLAKPWVEDPMNNDPRFTRVRLRQSAPELAALGFDSHRLAETARHLARVRRTLERATDRLQSHITRRIGAGMLLDGAAFGEADEEIALRLLSALLMEMGGQIYRPRFERLERLYKAILSADLGAGRTLHSCKISRAPKRFAYFGPQSILIRAEIGRQNTGKPS